MAKKEKKEIKNNKDKTIKKGKIKKNTGKY